MTKARIELYLRGRLYTQEPIEIPVYEPEFFSLEERVELRTIYVAEQVDDLRRKHSRRIMQAEGDYAFAVFFPSAVHAVIAQQQQAELETTEIKIL